MYRMKIACTVSFGPVLVLMLVKIICSIEKPFKILEPEGLGMKHWGCGAHQVSQMILG